MKTKSIAAIIASASIGVSLAGQKLVLTQSGS